MHEIFDTKTEIYIEKEIIPFYGMKRFDEVPIVCVGVNYFEGTYGHILSRNNDQSFDDLISR